MIDERSQPCGIGGTGGWVQMHDRCIKCTRNVSRGQDTT